MPNEKSGEKQPDYRIVGKTAHGNVEFGSAWKRTSEKGEFLSVSIDDPALPGSLNAALFTAEDGETATLVWTRPKRKRKQKPPDRAARHRLHRSRWSSLCTGAGPSWRNTTITRFLA